MKDRQHTRGRDEGEEKRTRGFLNVLKAKRHDTRQENSKTLNYVDMKF
jgi:hypothetical protein